jgi:IS1 family transposase
VVGLAFGDRSAATCRELWGSLPADDRKRAILYTDEWNAYSCVLPRKRHRPMPKGSGETNHIERLNNTLRQWCANLVRKTLSFSKDLELHKTRIRMVIEHCNARTDLWSAV